MSEISRISPSEVKPSVEGGGEGGGAGHKHLTRDNTGTTRTHISGVGTAGPEVPESVGAGKVLYGQDGAEGGAGEYETQWKGAWDLGCRRSKDLESPVSCSGDPLGSRK